MERIISAKANALSEMGHEVIIITAEQRQRPLFFKLSASVKNVDLGINYSENTSFLLKLLFYIHKRRKHEKKLRDVLLREKPDITISTMGNEFLFLYKINDGSKKILESHFARNYRLMYNRSFLWRLIDIYRTKQEESKVSMYDRFVVLTHEDKAQWQGVNNIEVIPNFILLPQNGISHTKKNGNVLIAVGRLTYQKGFDRLIKACSLVKDELYGWEIHIYGNGELKLDLQKQIEENDLKKIVHIYPAINNIEEVYGKATGLLFPSRFEGLAMVLIEAMSFGVPPIAFNCPCGASDVITNNKDGILVENGDIEGFSQAIKIFIENEEFRNSLSMMAYKKAGLFSKEVIMGKWNNLFNALLNI